MRAQIRQDQPLIALLACLAVILLPALPASAVNAGTAGALFLKHHFSPRAEAMAEAFTAVADDAQAAYWNPAGLARLSNDEISTSFSKGIFDDYFSQLAYARCMAPRLAFSGGFAYYDGGRFDLVDDEGRTQGLTAQRDYLLSLAAGYRLNSTWSVGLTASGLYSTLLDASGMTGTLNLGAAYEPEWLPALRAGLVVKHLGPDLGYGGSRDPLPLCGQMGIAYQLLPLRSGGIRQDLTVAVDVNAGVDSPVYLNLGAEYWFARSLAVRTGYKFNRALEGLTMGLGIRFPLAEDRLQLDYALGFAAGLDATHKLAVAYLFPSAKPAVSPSAPPVAGHSQAINENSANHGSAGQKKAVSLQVLEVVKKQKAVKQLILGSHGKITGLHKGQSGVIFNPGRQAVGKCTLSEIYPTRCVADVLSLSGGIKPGAQVEAEVE